MQSFCKVANFTSLVKIITQVRYDKGPTAKWKIMVFWLLRACLKRYHSHFWHADAISHCADNGLVFLQKISQARIVFLKKIENGKV